MSDRTVQDWTEYLEHYIADMASDARALEGYQDVSDVVHELQEAYTHLMIAQGYLRHAIFEQDD